MIANKEAAALVIYDKDGKFLVVKRADDPSDELAGVWGFPAVTLKDGETQDEAALRVGQQKLGVDVEIGNKIGESTRDRKRHVLHLTDYEARIVRGIPQVPQADQSVSQYQECKFTDDPSILKDAARKGSQCTQLFLESIEVTW